MPVGASLSNLAVVLTQAGHYAEAEDRFREALAIWRAIFTQDHWRTMNDLRNLGIVLQLQGKYEEGLPYLQEAVAVNQRLFGADSPQVGYLKGQVGVLLLHVDRPEAAYRHVEEALRLIEASADVLPASMLADTQQRMGQVLLERRAFEAAAAYFREALAYRRRVLPEGDAKVAEAQCGLGTALAAQGAVEEAVLLLRDAVPLYAAWGQADRLLLAQAQRALDDFTRPGL